MRHLYDLVALKDIIFNNCFLFTKLVKELYEQDKKRSALSEDKTLKQAISATAKKLTEDKAFENDYTKFVQNMSYSTNKISFSSAINNFKKISETF
jgi:hypothetical protein